MENKFKYPLISTDANIYGRTHIEDQNGLVHLLVYRGIFDDRGRYATACLNACMGMDLESLESGAAGWITRMLKNPTSENPFLQAAIGAIGDIQKMQLASEFKAIDLQKKLDAANSLNDALVQEMKAVKLKLAELEAKHEETLQELEDKEDMMWDKRDEY